jgi:hypothetical protein
MPLIANKSAVFSPTGATLGGTASYAFGASSTVKAEGQPVLLEGTTASVSGATNGTVVGASGTITFSASVILTVKADGKTVLGVGDLGRGTVTGTIPGSGSGSGSFNAEFIVQDAGQSTVSGT